MWSSSEFETPHALDEAKKAMRGLKGMWSSSEFETCDDREARKRRAKSLKGMWSSSEFETKKHSPWLGQHPRSKRHVELVRV